jgi:hypothetical protein
MSNTILQKARDYEKEHGAAFLRQSALPTT